MQRKQWLLIVLIGLLGIWLYQAPHSIACSCIPPDPVDREFHKASAVFEGRVTDIGQNFAFWRTPPNTRISFEVARVWKGPTNRTITVQSSPNSASCGYEFTIGEEYLVYTHGEQPLNVTLCSLTKSLADAQNDISQLNALVTPTSDLAEPPIINTDSPILLMMGGIVVLLLLGLATFFYWQRRQQSA